MGTLDRLRRWAGLAEASASAGTATTPARHERAEIATTLDGRDITRGWVRALELLAPQDSVLRLRGGGDYALYDELLRDDQVAATLGQRRLAVVAREWAVEPGDSRRASRKAAESLKAQLADFGWDRVTERMLYGVYYGFAVAECLWAADGAEVRMADVRVRDRRRFGFRGDGALVLKTAARPDGEPLPPAKFWHFATGATHDDEPYGLGLAHWLYWPVFFKRAGVRFWLVFLEKFGQPTAKGTYAPGTTPAEVGRLLEALRAIATDTGIAVPEGMAIELLEAARSGTVDYATLTDRMDRAIAKVVLGQIASSEGTPGRLGNDELQGDVRLDLLKADADLVCESFNRGPARWLTDWNYPGAAYPRVYREIEDPEDLGQVAERELKVFQMGFKPTLKHVQETYGGEWVEAQAPAPELPAGTPVAGAPRADPDDGGTPTEGDAAGLAESSLPERDTADRQADRLGREAAPYVADLLEPVRRLVLTAGSLEEIRDRLYDLYRDLPTADLASLMARAMTAAELAGCFDVSEGD